MKNFLKIVVVFAFFGFYFVDAQEVVKKDTINGTELSITMDNKIEGVLKDMEEKCSRDVNNTKSSNDIPKITTPKTNVVTPPKTTADICREHPKVSGFRIQVGVVKTSEDANQLKMDFRKRFPYLKAITDASLRPNYKILAGSYFSKQSANSDFQRVKQVFKDARVVEYYVFCVEAK